MKFIASFSGGKDSLLALDRTIENGHEAVGLLVTTNSKEKSWFHDIDIEILSEIADSLEIPIFFCPCSMGEMYTQDYEKALKQVKIITGAKACIFGDIDIEDHRAWCQGRADNVGLEAMYPLWQEKREELVREFIGKGYKTMIKKVDKNKLPTKFLGKTLDEELIEELITMEIDPCGENGEYHTLVYDGPKFRRKINLKIGKITESEMCYEREVYLI